MKNYILSPEVAEKKLQRIAYEIIENNSDEQHIILAGIRESGSVIARNIQRKLVELCNLTTQLLTISLDKKTPRSVQLSEKIDLNNKVIIVIDDVSNTGRTLLYAMKPLLDFLPKKIQTLVLVERSHKAFPVQPDYVGLSVATTLQEHIFVEVEAEKVKGAYME